MSHAPAHAAASVAPFFEDLHVGQVERGAPPVTLTSGMAAAHQAIVGDRLRLALDRELARDVLGSWQPMAHPALVWDIAIGQSTLLTRRVIANLFYRGLALRRFPVLDDTLATTVEVVAMRRTSQRDGRPPSGLAALRVRTNDQEGREVLDFWRCAMLPLRDADARAGREDSFDDQIPAALDPGTLASAVSTWSLEALPDGSARVGELRAGALLADDGGDVVSSAPELARLTLNVAAVHRDSRAHAGGRRLVYGGHTIGLAAAQASRVLPEIATIIGWHSCEHLAPVHEGDTLTSTLEVERLAPLGARARLADLRSRVSSRGEPASEEALPVLDWRFVALLS